MFVDAGWSVHELFSLKPSLKQHYLIFSRYGPRASSLTPVCYIWLCIYSLEYLKQKINSDVGKVDLEGSEITIGSLCVAKFTEDDM